MSPLNPAEDQIEMFATATVPRWRPDLEKVRARLLKILSEAAGSPDSARLSLYRTAFPELAQYLPDGERADFLARFEATVVPLDNAA